jgi:hypothetical protein
MMIRAIGLSAAAGILAVSTAFATGPLGYIKVGAWQGAAYTDDQTGAFAHCTAQSLHPGGAMLFVGLNIWGYWRIGFFRGAWQVVKGQRIALSLTFDGQFRYTQLGLVLSLYNDANIVMVEVPRGFGGDQKVSQFQDLVADGRGSHGGGWRAPPVQSGQ